MNTNLHLEILILEGITLPSHQFPMLKASLENELGRLLVRKGIAPDLQRVGAIKTVRTESVRIVEENGPSHLGKQIAKSVHGGLT